MPPLSRSILGPVLQGVEAPLVGRQTGGRRVAALLHTTTRCTSTREVEGRKRWEGVWRQQQQQRRPFNSSAVKEKPFPPPPAKDAKARRSNAAPLLGALFGMSALAVMGAAWLPGKEKEVEVEMEGVDAVSEEDTDKIRLLEVTKHDRNADTKWVMRGSEVYDITDFIDAHPGGEVILRACGGSIDPYWKIIAVHQTQEVYDMLAQYHIGSLDPRDLDAAGNIDWNVLGEDAKNFKVDDPFAHDPERDERLIYRTAKPCNAETPGNLLVDFLTPLKLFFVRNHLWVPQSHEASQTLTIELSDGEEKSYSIEDLKAKFKHHTITATLQCAGNRRGHMSKSNLGKTSGLQWDIGAIGTAEFSGVRLRDVLKDAGYCVDSDCPTPNQATDDCDKHVQFISPGDTYAASIPLQTAINAQADVLLAWDMNGIPLNRDHGGPIRAIVPGTTAARSVKWLGRIEISSEESSSHHQQRDYKCFGPNMKLSAVQSSDWDGAQSIQETPVQSAITKIQRSKSDDKETTTIQGFAFAGGGRGIVRVDVSTDGGKSWQQADLQQDSAKGSRRWAWTLWKLEVEGLEGGEREVVVKAVDDSYNSQPETFESSWNFRGLCANAWDRRKVDLGKEVEVAVEG